jgi:hypothetical protein
VVSPPAWLTAAASVPTRLDLKWAPVANATLYSISRSSTADPIERTIYETPAGTGDQDLAGKYYYHFDYLPQRSGGVTFSYKVYAAIVGAHGSRNLSGPSPTATVRAMIPEAPPKLKWRAALSPIMGRLRVTLEWGSVPTAIAYHIVQVIRPGVPPLPMAETTVRQTFFTIDNVVPGQAGTVCVITVYDGMLKDDTVRSCDWVVTSAR